MNRIILKKSFLLLIILVLYYEFKIKRKKTELFVCKENNENNFYNPRNYSIYPQRLSILTSPVVDYNTTYDVIAYVFNHVENYEKRKAIRSTWANKLLFPNLKVVFILGMSNRDRINKEIQKENNLHNDIIQGNFLVNKFANIKLNFLI